MSTVLDELVPDIGDVSEVEVIDVLVKAGDSIQAEQSIVTLESDKASMDVPASHAGTVKEVLTKVGDKVSQGSVLLRFIPAEEPESSDVALPASVETAASDVPVAVESLGRLDTPPASNGERDTAAPGELPLAPPALPANLPEDTVMGSLLRPPPVAVVLDHKAFVSAHASPGVRRFARELGVDLSKVKGSGRKGRVTRDDVQRFVNTMLKDGHSASPVGGMGIPKMPEVNFSKFGPVATRPLSRIKKISGKHLHRVWLNVPMVTHHDEADVTDMEVFRKALKDEPGNQGLRVTPLAFLLKAAAVLLRMHPHVNASISADGESLILKKYYHIGVAVDTPHGLVVPVIKDVDQKGVLDLAAELGKVSARARAGKLKSHELQGGCFSISSLGGIGGTAFTPVVNAPEVAILGVTRSRMTPVWNGEEFVPRLMLPLDLTYDHRVIDGAQAARFMVDLCALLADLRRLLL
jgi:pyruvate dehydrogenase E2 component (dihydrolipoamide acetyltransferase)